MKAKPITMWAAYSVLENEDALWEETIRDTEEESRTEYLRLVDTCGYPPPHVLHVRFARVTVAEVE